VFGEAILTNRPLLVTIRQYKPIIRITGKWCFENKEDSFNLAIRCDGINNSDNYKLLNNGIEVYVAKWGGGIANRGEVKSKAENFKIENNNFKFSPKIIYNFELIDYQNSIIFEIKDNESSLKLSCDVVDSEEGEMKDFHFIALYNRERVGTAMVSYLYDFCIEKLIV